MAVRTRIESAFTYKVRLDDPCRPFWQFTLVVGQDGRVGVRSIKSPLGALCDSLTQIPEAVLDEINAAKQEVEDLVAQSSALNGTLNFVAQTAQTVLFAVPFSGTNYRVYVTLGDFIDYRIVDKLTTGFTIELNVTYTGTVQYDVFV